MSSKEPRTSDPQHGSKSRSYLIFPGALPLCLPDRRRRQISCSLPAQGHRARRMREPDELAHYARGSPERQQLARWFYGYS